MATSPLYNLYDPYGLLRAQAEAGGFPDEEDDLADIGVVGLTKPRPSLSDLLPPEEKRTMLRGLAEMGTSGLAGMGWILDTPGAMVRGGLSGGLGKAASALWETSDERVTGRELGRQYGLVGDEDNWQNFIGGMIAEVALDPLTYVAPGAILGRGALTPTGKAMKAAGLLRNASERAWQGFDPLASGVVAAQRPSRQGIRSYMRSITPEQAIAEAVDPVAARAAWEQQARRFGVDPARSVTTTPGPGTLVQQAPDAASRLLDFRIPLTNVGFSTDVFGSRFGDAIATGFDYVGENLKRNPYTGPAARLANAVFDSRVGGAMDADVQWDSRIARMNTDRAEEARRFLRTGMERKAMAVDAEAVAEQLRSQGVAGVPTSIPETYRKFNSTDLQRGLVDYAEAPDIQGPVLKGAAPLGRTTGDPTMDWVLENVPEFKAIRDQYVTSMGTARQSLTNAGLPTPNWQSEYGTNMFPRQMKWWEAIQNPDRPNAVGRVQKPWTAGEQVLGLSDNFGRGRRAGTDIPGGQRTFRMLTGNANPNLDSAALQQSLIAANEQDARRILGQAFDTIGVERPFEREVAELAASKAYQTADPAAQKKLMDAAIGRMETKKDYLVNLLRGADLQFARNNTGIFDTAGWTNLNRYESGLNRVLENSKVVASRLDEASQPFVAGQLADGMMSIADAAEALKFDPDNFTAMFQQRFGKDPSAYAVSERLLQDLKTMSKPTRLGEPEGAVLSAIDNFTNAFKVSALASPAFHFRNNYSGAVSAANHGAFNPLDWYANLRASHGNYTLIGNRLKNAPGFENMTHAQRVDKYKDLMGAHQIGGGVVSDDITRLPEQEIRGSYIGATNEPNVLESLGTGLWDSSRGWREYRNNFFSMRGVGIFGNAPTQNRNPLLMANDAMGRQVEDALRGGVFLNQLRKGVNPGEAADLVRMSQVDYRPQAFSATERNFFKRVLPFYSFAKGILPSINDSLLYRPGGLQGQAVRAVTRGTQPTEDNFIPEHMRQSAAIPLPADLPGILGGSSRPGLQRYLTNLDLPWESTFQMFAPGVGATMSARVGDSLRKTGSNILGNTNPLLKAPLEYIFNRQMYTGRDLTDLYSVLERDMGEIGRPAEQVIANLPFGSRGLGLYRQLTDTRLDPTDRYAKAFFNQVFGAKLTDIDEERSKQQAARAMLNTMLQTTPGVRTYENVTVPEEALMAMPDDQRRMYLLYRVIQSEAAKRARQRKKAQEMLTGPTI